MRNRYSKLIYEIVREDKDVMLILADLGYTVFEDVERDFPDQIINVGIAEQNMVGIAAGLALMGKKPVIYSIVPFVTMRCFEQIRTDLCYHNLNVKIVGIGSGFSYSSGGPTHHAIEDLIIMMSLPNMKVICPANAFEVEAAIKFAFNDKGPVYISLSKKPSFDDVEHTKISEHSYRILSGEKIALIANGSILKNSYLACTELKKEGLDVSLYSMPFLKPFDKITMQKILKNYKYIFAVQEQNTIGGLVSCISSVIAENIDTLKESIIFKKIGVNDKYIHEVGSIDFYEQMYGLTKEDIKKIILDTVKTTKFHVS